MHLNNFAPEVFKLLEYEDGHHLQEVSEFKCLLSAVSKPQRIQYCIQNNSLNVLDRRAL